MLSAVVLAGGKGSRMGAEKALIRLGSDPMICHVLDTVCEVADEVFVSVSKGAGSRYVEVVGTLATIVEDEETGRGPLEGLRRVFRQARGEYVLVTPCDTPFISADVLRLLAQKAAGRDAAVPVVRGYVEPLLAAYRKHETVAIFDEELTQGNGKMGNVVARMDVNLVPESDIVPIDPLLRSFWNINSREELARAEKMLREQSPGG
jgi:molybdopterin-guanine dinucleotide biosynthesis protein A